MKKMGGNNLILLHASNGVCVRVRGGGGGREREAPYFVEGLITNPQNSKCIHRPKLQGKDFLNGEC